ncbi:hypothetical protein D3C84_974210 [compost metagenome]
MALAGLERLQPTQLIDPLRLVGEQHSVSIESDAQFIAGGSLRTSRQDGRRSEPGFKRTAHIVRIGRQEQMTAESRQIRIRTAPTNKGSTVDTQTVMLDGVEHT